MSNELLIQEGAVFIADSHYNNYNRRELLSLLQNIEAGQIFLMGDIFDFLADEIDYFKQINKEIISLINKLSQEKKMVYLEGNHDFNISRIFPNIKVIQRDNQPFLCKLKDKTVALSHGDIFTPVLYNIYTRIIRNHYILTFLNIIDINNFISIKIDNWLLQKNICKDINSFEEFAKKRVEFYKSYNVKMIVEGHFHQGKELLNYINIPSLACSKKYAIISNDKFVWKEL